MNPIVGFFLNVLSVSLVFALIGSVLWPVLCNLLHIPSGGTNIDSLLILMAAFIFIVIRDYRHICWDCVNKAKSATKYWTSVGRS